MIRPDITGDQILKRVRLPDIQSYTGLWVDSLWRIVVAVSLEDIVDRIAELRERLLVSFDQEIDGTH